MKLACIDKYAYQCIFRNYLSLKKNSWYKSPPRFFKLQIKSLKINLFLGVQYAKSVIHVLRNMRDYSAFTHWRSKQI
jgi:hypothetical protein